MRRSRGRSCPPRAATRGLNRRPGVLTPPNGVQSAAFVVSERVRNCEWRQRQPREHSDEGLRTGHRATGRLAPGRVLPTACRWQSTFWNAGRASLQTEKSSASDRQPWRGGARLPPKSRVAFAHDSCCLRRMPRFRFACERSLHEPCKPRASRAAIFETTRQMVSPSQEARFGATFVQYRRMRIVKESTGKGMEERKPCCGENDTEGGGGNRMRARSWLSRC